VSAKGRKPKTGDTGAEFYPTEAEAVEALILSPLLTLPGGVWLEPCVGTGSIVRSVQRHRSDVQWICVDIDPRVIEHVQRGDHIAVLEVADFLTYEVPSDGVDVLITNPAFSITLDVIRRGMEIHAEWICILQRQGWFGTKGRADWLRRHCPDSYTLPWRPSFRPDGGTDSIEYAWFVWPENGHDRRHGVNAMLDAPGGQLEIGGAA
jgi:hypothetical protein